MKLTQERNGIDLREREHPKSYNEKTNKKEIERKRGGCGGFGGLGTGKVTASMKRELLSPVSYRSLFEFVLTTKRSM